MAATMDDTGTSATLSVVGGDDAGESLLTYVWSTAVYPENHAPTIVTTQGTNAAKTTQVTFTALGEYAFNVEISDEDGYAINKTIVVTVQQVLSSITVSSATSTVDAGATQDFTAEAFDQFHGAMATQPEFTWSSTAGSITDLGADPVTGQGTAEHKAPNTVVPDTVTAESGSVGGSYVVAMTNTSPTTSLRLGDSTFQPQWEQSLGSPTVAADRVAQIAGTATLTVAGSFEIDPTESFPAPTENIAYHTTYSTNVSHPTWSAGGVDSRADDVASSSLTTSATTGQSWSYYEALTSSYTVTTYSGATATGYSWSSTSSGSRGYTFSASPSGSSYTVTPRTRPSSGKYVDTSSGSVITVYWTQTTDTSETVTTRQRHRHSLRQRQHHLDLLRQWSIFPRGRRRHDQWYRHRE